MKKISLFICVLLFNGCSLSKKGFDVGRYVLVTSDPSQAEVYSSSLRLLGVTPLKISSEEVVKIEESGFITVTLKKMAYLERQVTFNSLGVSDVNVRLSRIDEQELSRLLGGPLSSKVNEIIKDIMTAQENIVRENYADARVRLDNLIRLYPSFSSSYILKAAVSINDKKYREAKILLQRALSLDETNEVAKTYLQYVNTRMSE